MSTRVMLREVSDEDLPIFFEQQRDADANRMVAFTHRDPDDRDAFMAHWDKIRRAPSVVLRTIVFDGHVAGNTAKFENEGNSEVCYFLGKEYWGMGIATAALSQLLDEVATRPLYAGVAEDNTGSIRVLEKCGFKVIERRRSFARFRGKEIGELILMLS